MFPDFMIDIETTGLSPDRTGIIQLAAVRFNLKERTVDPNTFDMGLILPPDRFWDEGTRNWWLRDKRTLLESIIARGKDPAYVLDKFTEWMGPQDEAPVFWGKPTHFDFTFLQSYFRSYNRLMPFHYRPANDMNSFLRGAFYPQPVPQVEVELEGDHHNALYDCFWQIQCLFKTMDLKK